jgi:putative tryptophan/tyrosine transport system substrate-binding protein
MSIRGMKRRAFIAALGGAAAWPLVARAQGIERRPVVGLLSPASAEAVRPYVAAIRARLAELGYVDGRNYELVIRNAPLPDRDAALRLGAELLALSPAVIMMGAPKPWITAIRQLTSSVPVVFVNFNDDPVALGIAASIAHPGGNMTGFMLSSDRAIVGKQLELLKELTPPTARVDALFEAQNVASERLAQDAARILNLSIRTFFIAHGEELAPMIASAEGNADGLLFGAGPLFNTMRRDITMLVARTRLPAVYHDRELVVAGGLMSYGSSIQKNYAAAAEYVAKILGGAKPGDLPIQQPAIYDLVINAKTASILGLSIPPTLLARADEVIE